ncbi:MAG: UDP-N-acetylmuramoyl-tripeptide--D-alanyl-D-alanine ligase, partial [Gammaproteobacteria bacterium]
LALGDLARFWRGQFSIPFIGVTGSNGKTTVKEMIGSIMSEIGPGCVTRGNLNNDIGMPLTLLRLRANDRYAVIEMGMNHLGEIDYLTRITRPTVALITNAAEAHLAGVGGLQQVAQAKGEIFSGLTDDGVAIINADDRFADYWRGRAKPHRVLTFGLERAADITCHHVAADNGSDILLMTPTHGEILMRLPLLGKHNVMNAMAAAAASLSAGASMPQIKAGLEKLKGISGRLEIKQGVSGARVIDDTYNANPGSLAAGLQVLRDCTGERVLVLGDMAELGPAADDIHRRVGELAKSLGVERLYALGPMAALAVKSFGQGGRHFQDAAALIEALIDAMHADMTLLVKGSRVMQMERVVAGIVRQTPPAGGQR